MKTIFTLFLAVGLISMAQAQSGYGKGSRHDRRNDQSTVEKDYGNGRDVYADRSIHDNDRRYNGIMSPTRQRDLAIARVNREYDWKIQKVRNNGYKSRSKKRRQIRSLNDQRQREISRIYFEFSKDGRNRDYSNRRY